MFDSVCNNPKSVITLFTVLVKYSRSRIKNMNATQYNQMTPADKSIKLSSLNIEFTPDEAKKALVALIDEKINQYKINYWKAWERDHSVCRKVTDAKINALTKQKEALLSLDPNQKELILKLEGNIMMESAV